MVGKTCRGKSTLINNVVGEDFANLSNGIYPESTIPSHIYKTFVINNTQYHCHFTELPDLDYRPTQPVSYDEHISMVIADQRMDLEKVNLIIYVSRLGRFTSEDHTFLQKYTGVFKNAHNISAYVITNCDSKNDAARTRIVEDFKSNGRSKDFAAIMGKGIYTVGFPDLDDMDDEDREHVKRKMQKDVIKLHELIKESNDVVDVLKSKVPGGCSFI